MHWRRHWKLAVAAVGAPAVLLFALGHIRVAGFTFRHGPDLFDSSMVHSVEVTFDSRDYQAAVDTILRTFAGGSEKAFIRADVVIDGTRVEDVGMRLKGNVTLAGLMAEGFGDPGSPSDYPEDLPWLISFDEFVAGRTYQGHEKVAVRPGGRATAETTALNEALSLSLIDLAGEPAEEAAYAAFSVNGGAAALRLIVQEPGDSLVADDFLAPGVLYKALSGSAFECRGGDTRDYGDSFRQVTGLNRADLAPLIEFVCWVEESSDEEFAAELEDRVDISSLARYLALHNLLLDWDDLSGPGQNYYLWYDLATERFTVVSWDLNSSFSGDPARGPYDAATPWVEALGLGEDPPEGITLGERPESWGERPAGDEGPLRVLVGGGQPAAPRITAPASRRVGHVLEERFMEVGAFRASYVEAYRDLYQALFANGMAVGMLDRWAATLAEVEGDLIDAATLESEATVLRELINARTTALASSPLVAEP